MAVGEENGGGVRRRGCTFQKNDFFPEESFKSWGNYGRSVMETPFRLKDRVLKRSSDHSELFEVKARSGNEMKKTLNWWDLIWFGIGAVVGSGIFVLTGLEARHRCLSLVHFSVILLSHYFYIKCNLTKLITRI
uniref:Cationic amino acid transporter 1-like n=1 Tax=Cicer arietinum TaxID=3827 RepID=A0A3Q7YD32_CICAR|nr:cationic amino acid transporter 1-like [Cicer arietinum]